MKKEKRSELVNVFSFIIPLILIMSIFAAANVAAEDNCNVFCKVWNFAKKIFGGITGVFASSNGGYGYGYGYGCEEIVSYWRAENNALDSFGSNDGTAQNGVTYSTGQVGNAFNFDGINDQIVVGTSGFPYESSSRTIEAWIKTTKDFGGLSYILQYGSIGGIKTMFAFWMNSNGAIGFDSFGYGNGVQPGNTPTNATPVNDGNWHHLVGTYDGNIMILYVDGIFEGSTNVGAINTNSVGDVFWIGRSDNGEHWQGSIDEVAVYNRKLLQSEVQALYAISNSGEPYCDIPEECGNNIKESGEICDGTDVPSCKELNGVGWTGTVTCAQDCLSYVEDCFPPAPPDIDGDGVVDDFDKCVSSNGYGYGGYIYPWFAEQELKPNHYDSSNWNIANAYGCSCSQVLYCKPGNNNGEFKFGCSAGTKKIWETQDPDSWALDCQVNGKVILEGVSKGLFTDTDDGGWLDLLDADNDNDGLEDADDDQIDDKDPVGDPDHGTPDWHPKSKHKK